MVLVLISLVMFSTLQGFGFCLELSQNSATTKEPPSCSPCECVVIDGRIIADCSERKLKKFPNYLPENIRELRFDGNKMASMFTEQGVCEFYKNLKSLSFARNKNPIKNFSQLLKGCDDALEKLDVTDSVTQSALLTLEELRHLKSLRTLVGLELSGPLAQQPFGALDSLEKLSMTYKGADLPLDLFTELTDLKSLRLDLEKVVSFADGPLETKGLTEFYLKGFKVLNLRRSFFSEMSRLAILDLHLPAVDSLSWPNQEFFVSLRHMSITGVSTVSRNTLSGMTSLETLRLTNIWTLEGTQLFQDMARLEVLEVTACNINRLGDNWLSGLDSLSELNLSDNRISQLDKNALVDVPKLRSLILSNNRIIQITPGFLDPLTVHLETLSLNKNRLTTLDQTSFPMLENVMALDLSGNYLPYFDLNISKHMPKLTHLQLQENMIDHLSGKLFSPVEHVNVSHNQLAVLPPELIVESLMDLDISSNSIDQGLPVSEMMKLKNLKELTINGLTVDCDCSMQHLVRAKAVHGGQCSSELQDMPPKAVGDILNDFICGVTSTYMVGDDEMSIKERSVTVDMTTRHPEDGVDQDTRQDDGAMAPEISRDLFSANDNINDNNSFIGVLMQESEATASYSDGKANSDTNSKEDQSQETEISWQHDEGEIEKNGSQTAFNGTGNRTTAKINNSELSDTNATKMLDMNETQQNVDRNSNKMNHGNSVREDDDDEEKNGGKEDNSALDFTAPSNNSLNNNHSKNVDQKKFDEFSNYTKTNPKAAEVEDGVKDDNFTTLVYDREITKVENKNDTDEDNDNGINSTRILLENKNTNGRDNVSTRYRPAEKSGMITPAVPTTTTTTVDTRTSSTTDLPGNDMVSDQMSPSKKVYDDEEEEDWPVEPTFVFPVIVLVILAFICFAVTLIRRMRRSGSQNLEHRRQKGLSDDDVDESKMVMTELGKSRVGQEVIIM